jgi:hypothetical protein
MADLSGIQTTAQNIVSAINGVAQTYLTVQGVKNAANISAATLVKVGQGRIASVSVLVAGAAGKIYDTNLVTSTANEIFVIPATVGVFVVNFPLGLGLVVAPGAAQVVSVSYS